MKIAVLFSLLLTPAALLAQTVKTSFVVSNIEPGKGSLVLNIYNKKENFFKTEYLKKTQKATKATQTFTTDLPAGTYSVAIYQDFDENGALKLGLFSIPKEPVGFGNNYRPKLSSPTFDDCAVVVAGKEVSFAIKLN